MNPISTIDIINFIHQIASLNVAYLGISVTIIALLGGGLFAGLYFFTIRPFKETLDRQEKSFIDLKGKVEEKIATIIKLEEKLNIDEKRLIDVEKRTIDQTLENIWTQHYVAQSTSNFGGDMLSLVWYLRLTQIFKRGNIQLCLEQIKRVLDQDSGTLLTSVVKMKSWNPKIVTQIFSDILISFNTIQEFKELKEEIQTKAIQKWFSPTAPTLPVAQITKF